MQKIFGSDQSYHEYRNLAEIGHKTHQRNTIKKDIISADKNSNSFSSPFYGDRKLDQSVSQLPRAQQTPVGKVMIDM